MFAVWFDLGSEKPDTLRALHYLPRLKLAFLFFKVHLSIEDHFLDIIACLTIEGVVTEYHRVHEDTKCPDVNLWIALCMTLYQLRGHIFDAPSVVLLCHRAFIGTKYTEISDFHVNFRWCRFVCR